MLYYSWLFGHGQAVSHLSLKQVSVGSNPTAQAIWRDMRKRIKLDKIIYSLLFYLCICFFPFNRLFSNIYVALLIKIIFFVCLILFLIKDNDKEMIYDGEKIPTLFLPLIIGVFSNYFLFFFGKWKINEIDFLLLFEEIMFSIVISFCEEILFRHLLFNYLEKHFKRKRIYSILISSMIFSVFHFLNAFTIDFFSLICTILYTFALGIVLCIVRIKSKLIYAIIGHSLFNIINGDIFQNIFIIEVSDIAYILVNLIVGILLLIYAFVLYYYFVRREDHATKNMDI